MGRVFVGFGEGMAGRGGKWVWCPGEKRSMLFEERCRRCEVCRTPMGSMECYSRTKVRAFGIIVNSGGLDYKRWKKKFPRIAEV